jgi:hypothetical protein
MRLTPLLINAVLSAILARTGVGQVQPTLAELQPNTKLRIQLVDSTTVKGHLLGLEGGHVRLRTTVRVSVGEGWVKDQDRQILLDSLAAAWVSTGTRWEFGAGLGAVVGAMGMFVAVEVAEAASDDPPCSAWCWTEALALGAGAGAVLGGLVGHQFVVWRPLSF